VERRERIHHLIEAAETNVALAHGLLHDYGEMRMVDVRKFAKEARKKLGQAIEAIDGVD
jgi:5'-deoxynucleotidase YfbR-like HD superfamily hydrolase